MKQNQFSKVRLKVGRKCWVEADLVGSICSSVMRGWFKVCGANVIFYHPLNFWSKPGFMFSFCEYNLLLLIRYLTWNNLMAQSIQVSAWNHLCISKDPQPKYIYSLMSESLQLEFYSFCVCCVLCSIVSLKKIRIQSGCLLSLI